MLQNKEEHMVKSRFSLPQVNAEERRTAEASVDERRNVMERCRSLQERGSSARIYTGVSSAVLSNSPRLLLEKSFFSKVAFEYYHR